MQTRNEHDDIGDSEPLHVYDDIDRSVPWPMRLLMTIGALVSLAVVVVLSLLVLTAGGCSDAGRGHDGDEMSCA